MKNSNLPLTNYSIPLYNTAPIIIGSEASLIPENQRSLPEISHRWRCYVKIEPTLVKAVHFRLHESFINPLVIIEKPPFEITEYGWGEFNIQIKIVLFNDDKILTSHFLVLHSDNNPHVSETLNTVVYKDEQLPITEDYNFEFDGESEEYKNIDNAIEYLLNEYEKISRI